MSALYALAVPAAYVFQYRPFYYPDAVGAGEITRMAAGVGLALWPPDVPDPEYRAPVSAGSGHRYRGSVAVFHGNTGSAIQRTCYLAALGLVSG